jgi:hypothetical protein
MVNVLEVLKISRETWDTIPKRDRDRIVKAVRKGTYAEARKIATAILKRKSTKKTTRKTKKRAEWWA